MAARGKFPFGPTAGPSAVPLRPPQFRDRLGRILHPGDQILPSAPLGLIVARIEPALAPNVPPNHVLVVLQAQQTILVPADVPVNEFIRVQSAAERGLVVGAADNGQPPAEDGTPREAASASPAADEAPEKRTILSTEE